jgi:hypothetical protein
MVKHLAGATPVYAWDAPLMDADYSGLVYKLFTRGDEDIIALWSNAEEYQQLALLLAAEPTQFKQVTLTSFETVLPRADEPERLAIFTESKSVPPESILVRPIKQFYFLSVISDRPGFGWLADITSSPSQPPTPTPTSTSTPSSYLPSRGAHRPSSWARWRRPQSSSHLETEGNMPTACRWWMSRPSPLRRPAQRLYLREA